MKTLLIITSIILISFQIDRLFVQNVFFDGDAIDIPHYTGSDLNVLPDIAPSAPADEVQNALPAVNASVDAVADPAAYTEEVAPATAQSPETNFTRINEKNMLLHQQLKHSDNYLAITTLQFHFNEYQNIETKAFNSILQLADRLIFDASLKLSIAGFTDITGSPEYNQKLSLLRAENIKEYMIDLGVKESQVIVSANGVSFPIASNNTGEGRAANRRVEMLLIK